MEKFEQHRDEAKSKLKVADHLLTITYPMVQDPKLLLTVLQNLFSCFENGMNSVLEHEKYYKNIMVLPESFEPRFQIFSGEVAPTHKIPKDYLQMMQEIREVLESHKESPVEFSRKGSYIICNDSYKVKQLSVDNIKDRIAKTKEFVQVVERAIK